MWPGEHRYCHELELEPPQPKSRDTGCGENNMKIFEPQHNSFSANKRKVRFSPEMSDEVKFVGRFFLDLCDACLYKNALTTVKTVVPTTNINNKKNCYTLVKSGFGRFLFLTHYQAGIRA